MVSIAVGAGIGGALTATSKPMLEREKELREQDWEMAKYDRLRSDQLLDVEQERTFKSGIAQQERFMKGSEFMLTNMVDRYKSINNRLRGEQGFPMLPPGPERIALGEEKDRLVYNMQVVANGYLTAAYGGAIAKEMLPQLWPHLFETNEEGDITDVSPEGKKIELANARLDKSFAGEATYGGMDDPEEIGGKSIDPMWEEGEVRKQIASTEYDFPGKKVHEERLGRERRAAAAESARAFGKWITGGKYQSLVKLFAGGGEAGDAEWEKVKRALTEEAGETDIISDERASELVTGKILEGLKSGAIKISTSLWDILKKGVSNLEEAEQNRLEELQEIIRSVTPTLESEEGLDDETLAQMDKDMASGMYREFASTDDEGLLAAGGGGGLIKGATGKWNRFWDETVRPNVGGRIPQEFWDFYEKNPELYQAIASGAKSLYGKLTDKPSGGATEGIDLGTPPSSGRPYGETRPEDFIGSTEAIDALGRAGGPAADALTEWTPERSKARLMEDVKKLIRRAESARGGYNAVAGRKDGDPDLTSMTIGAIHKKYGDKAVGVGQFKRRYLLDNAKKYLGYNSKELDALVFDDSIQEQFLEFGIQESGIDAYIAGTIDVDKFQANLAIRWRGLPPLGTSLKGDPSDERGNIIQIPGDETQEILERWKKFSE